MSEIEPTVLNGTTDDNNLFNSGLVDNVTSNNLDEENITEEIKTVKREVQDDKANDSVAKPARKRPTEVDALKGDFFSDNTADYDAYEDSNQIYRQYRLRDAAKKPCHNGADPKPPKRRKRAISVDTETVAIDCQKCGKVFNTKTSLLNHMRIHQTVVIFTCALCMENFKTNKELIEHKSIHDKEDRLYLCKECKMAFTDHCDFLIHGLSHILRTQYKCIECGLVYNSKDSYKIHIYTHFDRKLQCPLCSHQVNGAHNLQSHIKHHDYKFECNECGKTLSCKSHLDYHMLSHTGLKPFQCLYCGKGFKSGAQRRVHTRVHTDEKPYSCDVCGWKFRQQTDMNRHKTRHSEKKFRCEICDKKFLLKPDLVSHMRIHTKEDLYKCTECDREFTTLCGLKTHILFKHTAERPVRCELCDHGFINKNQYDKHCRSKKHKRNEFGAVTKNEVDYSE